MADIRHALMIKYGLGRQPTQAESDIWFVEVEKLKRQGVSSEEAGRRAAQAQLPGFKSKIYASEGDTVETLLLRVRDK
ncbi:hypothetical protein [Terricaulis sp.]|uniref:hypothetical protein n=1 Tax=Terricaulis sp. TaxID=2768686 RepID=UPI002AC43864|nr:hypothetical protein [Terricaulis sp.]MDZ4693422.1 hypothetical protein [Terricaulis sp.]